MAGLNLPKGWNDIPITALVKADWNYKTNDDDKLAKLRENIKRNGQIENIIVRELDTGFYEIVNGNHRYDALIELGIEQCHVYNLGKISLTQAQRIAIETNETRFESDGVKLAEIVRDIMVDFDPADLVETMPYTPEEIENMNKSLDFNWDQFNSGDTTEGADESKEDDKTTFIITVAKNEDIIEQDLQEICDRYTTAKLKVK